MATELDELNFFDDVEDAKAHPDAARWSIERQDGLVVNVELSPMDAPQEKFLACLRWTEYPGRMPASVVFLEPATLQVGVPTAWPIAAGFRPPQDICATWTAEGFVAHPEWHDDPSMTWIGGENPVLTQIQTLQHELDCTYQGRHK